MAPKNKPPKRNVKEQKKNMENGTNKYKAFKIALLVLNLLVVFYSPFVRGLYFEAEQLPAEIFVLISFALFWVMKYLTKDKRFISTPMEYASLALMLIYLISVITSVSCRLAISEWLKYCMFFCIFFMITDLSKDIKTRIAVLWTVIGTAMGLSIIGLDSSSGGRLVDMLNNLFKSLHFPVEFFGLYVNGRIHSTIQYPNALAVYLLVSVLISLGLSMISEKLWQRIISGACSTVLSVTLLLTLSRGVLILVPFVLLMYIILIPRGYKLRTAMLGLNSAISAAVSLLVGYAVKSLDSHLWIRVLIGVLVYIALTILFEFLVSKVVDVSKLKLKIKPVFLLVPLAVVMVVLAILINTTEPLVLKSKSSDSKSGYSLQKSIQLEPNKEYRLEVDASANESNGENSVEVRITSKSKKDIMFNTGTRLQNVSMKNIENNEKVEIPFTVPEDSELIVIQFTNTSEKSEITLDNARIVSPKNNKTVKKLPLAYKFVSNSVMGRFSNLFQSKSFFARILFIQDGLKIFKDHWLLGAGGSGWSVLTFSYQSYLYWSTQAHSYIVQIAVETGIIGVLIFIMLILSIIAQFIIERKHKKEMDNNQKILQVTLLISIFTLYIHSMLDFDLSISSVYILLWTVMALFNSSLRHERVASDNKEAEDKGINRLLQRIGNLKPLNINCISMVIVSLLVMVVPFAFATAAHYDKKSEQYMSEGNIELALENIKKAVSFDRLKSDYKIKYCEQLISKETITKDELLLAKKLRDDAFKIDKYNITTIENAGLLSLKLSEFDRGMEMFDRAIELRPFAERQWKMKADACYRIAEYYIKKDDTQNAKKYIEEGLEIISDARIKNEKNMNPIVFEAKTLEAIEKLAYLKDYPDEEGLSRIGNYVFLTVNEIDINHDGIPDQWKNLTPDNAEVMIENGFIAAKKTSESASGVMQTRNFNLEKGKKYRLELVLDNDVKEVSYQLMNYHNKYQKFEKTGEGTFSAVIDMKSEDINSNGFSVRLRIDKDLVIKSLTVTQVS